MGVADAVLSDATDRIPSIGKLASDGGMGAVSEADAPSPSSWASKQLSAGNGDAAGVAAEDNLQADERSDIGRSDVAVKVQQGIETTSAAGDSAIGLQTAAGVQSRHDDEDSTADEAGYDSAEWDRTFAAASLNELAIALGADEVDASLLAGGETEIAAELLDATITLESLGEIATALNDATATLSLAAVPERQARPQQQAQRHPEPHPEPHPEQTQHTGHRIRTETELETDDALATMPAEVRAAAELTQHLDGTVTSYREHDETTALGMTQSGHRRTRAFSRAKSAVARHPLSRLRTRPLHARTPPLANTSSENAAAQGPSITPVQQAWARQMQSGRGSSRVPSSWQGQRAVSNDNGVAGQSHWWEQGDATSADTTMGTIHLDAAGRSLERTQFEVARFDAAHFDTASFDNTLLDATQSIGGANPHGSANENQSLAGKARFVRWWLRMMQPVLSQLGAGVWKQVVRNALGKCNDLLQKIISP